MQEIRTPNDLIVAPTSYFKGMEQRLEKLARIVEVKTFDGMEQFLSLRDWMNPEKVDREVRKNFPNLRWDNIHLLLPPEENCSYSDSSEKDRE